MTDHPIAPPPPELVTKWITEERSQDCCSIIEQVAARAAQWGADQELEACCMWMRNQHLVTFNDRIPSLRAARRPKPPSLKGQALEAQHRLMTGDWRNEDWQLISRALEALDD